MKKDVIIVGAGFAGSILAHEFALKGKKVLIIEKRKHMAGNMYEDAMNGVRYHLYGPHIFHTNSEVAKNYMLNFGEWFFYEHRVVGLIDGVLVPIPFNFKSIEMLFSKKEADEIKKCLLESYELNSHVSILDLKKHENELIRKFGDYVFEKVFIHYTAKQWNTDISNVDTSVINRVPVVIGYDDRYFSDSYQMMPKNGYNEIFENLLNHENIEIRYETNATDLLEIKEDKIYFDKEEFTGQVIYTGAIDELFHYKFGPLPYRSLKMQFEYSDMNFFQPTSVVNYPNEEDFTRITEFKYLSQELMKKGTVILKEYPQDYNYQDQNCTPYYTIVSDEANAMYQKYLDYAKNISNIFFCGRLAEYKYYNMDAVILRALELFEQIK